MKSIKLQTQKKRLFTFLTVIICFITLEVNSQTYHTVTIDGSNDFTLLNEELSGTSGSKWYFSWDASKFYFALDAPDVSSNSSTKWIHAYFDVDPQIQLSAGNGTINGITYNTQSPVLPFKADYHFRWKADGSYSNIQFYNGSTGLMAMRPLALVMIVRYSDQVIL